MYQLIPNFNLKEFNTFNLNSIAEKYVSIESIEDLIQLNNDFNIKSIKHFILGGGSNIILPEYFTGLMINMNSKGISIIDEDNESVILSVSAGVVWHDFLEYCIENKYYGLENLALIPGKVGSAPVQNIGAYGIEQEEHLESVIGLDLNSNKVLTLAKKECEFGYRDSIFKNKLKENFIITSVQFKLNKKFSPILSYKELNDKFKDKTDLNPTELFNFIIETRQRKLPNPKEEGNAGSFFKNPIISNNKFNELTLNYNDLKGYHDVTGVKISAAWLIEKSGWKGKSLKESGKAAVSEKHSLVIVNKGNASAKDIIELSDAIINSVNDKFGIILEKEVNIIK